MTHFQEQFLKYLNAGIPIIYVNSFEAEKVKELIQDVIFARELVEINIYNMSFDDELSLEKQLAGMLESYVDNFEDTSNTRVFAPSVFAPSLKRRNRKSSAE